jgi:hydrogenase-4 membrane subunit HyfE
MSENHYQNYRRLTFNIIMIILITLIITSFALGFANIYIDVPSEINDKAIKTTGLTFLLTVFFAGGRAMYYDV